jgi:hypothetical protein
MIGNVSAIIANPKQDYGWLLAYFARKGAQKIMHEGEYEYLISLASD